MLKKIAVLFLLLITVLTVIGLSAGRNRTPTKLTGISTPSSGEVAGQSSETPQIYISGGNQYSSSGGLVVLSSVEKPTVNLTSFDYSGSANLTLYRATKTDLLRYLEHKSDGHQINKTINTGSMPQVTQTTISISSGYDETNEVSLPLEPVGLYLLQVQTAKTTEYAYIIRSQIGSILEQGNNEFILWSQDFTTKRKYPGTVATSYALEDSQQPLSSSTADANGVAVLPFSPNADIALVEKDSDFTLIPINLRYLNSGTYATFRDVRSTRYFLFTDRPLYRPGDKVYFKAVVRADDDARYSLPGGTVSLTINHDQETIFQKTYIVSPQGTFSGEYQLPQLADTGYYSVSVSVPSDTNPFYFDSGKAYTNFSVEHFRKPELFLDIAADNDILVSGDKASFNLIGTYFSGQPVKDQTVKYTIYQSEYYDYSYSRARQVTLNEYFYSYSGNKLQEGEAKLDSKGKATLAIDTKLPAGTTSQIFHVEAVLDDGTGNPSTAAKNILVFSGEFGLYWQEKSKSYGKVGQPLTVPVVIYPRREGVVISGVKLNAAVRREYYEKTADPNSKYPRYNKKTEQLTPVSVVTDSAGKAQFSFTPSAQGQYIFSVSAPDKIGNTITRDFYVWVGSTDYSFSPSTQSGLNVSADRDNLYPTDTAAISIQSEIPDRDIFFSIQRGRVDRYQVISLTGSQASVDINLKDSDYPNTFARVFSFSDNDLDSANTKIDFVPDLKKLNVNITADRGKYGPGDTVNLNITSTDVAGNSVPAELAVWAVDKAIFELASDNLGDIYQTFWSPRYDQTSFTHSLLGITALLAEGGGCFAADTPILMADKSQKPISQIKAGQTILTARSETDSRLVKAKVSRVTVKQDIGLIIINGLLKTTPDHLLWVNSAWTQAGNVRAGDYLRGPQGDLQIVTSVEYVLGKQDVYNLEVEKYNTFFAAGSWVHNQKGEGSVRDVFKDTAYWNGRITTDATGKAKVSFKLPDNLTTWTVAAVASTNQTLVGQTKTDLLVTKDVIVRPILPNVLRTGDQAQLSALVQNFTDQPHTFSTTLSYPGSETNPAQAQQSEIAAGQTQQIFWSVLAGAPNNDSKTIFSAQSASDSLSDTISLPLPVKPVGMVQTSGQVGEGPTVFSLSLDPAIDKSLSSAKLHVSSTLLGSLPALMGQLLNYPYGCVEQTTSRLVPALIAYAHKGLFSDQLAEFNIDKAISEGLIRLSELKNVDGGWSWWWGGGKSDPFITAYVVEYLKYAQKAGIDVGNLLGNGTEYLQNYYSQNQSAAPSQLIPVKYALSLLDPGNQNYRVDIKDNLTSDILALAVMANYYSGNTNPRTNGLDQLISQAKTQGESLYWEAGNMQNFGSDDISTALAVRAIITAGGNRDTAAKGVRFLTRSRQKRYWHNSFSASQTARAFLDFSQTGSELAPNFTYSVILDGKPIAQGTASGSNQLAKEINIPLTDVTNSSQLQVTQQGIGQIYSTLTQTEFLAGSDLPAVSNGLTVTRSYLTERGDTNFAVGDLVTITLNLSGLSTEEPYGVIEDELPAGMVPINERLKNEDSTSSNSWYYYPAREYTLTGAVIPLSAVRTTSTVSYKARVISAGTFSVPPARALMMYAPEIWGRSTSETITISGEPGYFPYIPITAPIKKMDKYSLALLASAGVFLVIIIGGVAYLIRRKKTRIINK